MRRSLILLLAAFATPAYAAHPLITEDTGTQGAGKFELELGSSLAHVDGGRIFELDPQLSYGVTPALDVILRPSLFQLSGDAADLAGRRGGFGNTALDVKWRFVEDGAWSLGTRAGLDLPTAQTGLGPQRGGAHALLALTYDGPLWLSANVAYTRRAHDPELDAARRNVTRLSLAAAADVHPRVRLVADLAAAQSDLRDVSGLQPVALVGAIVHIVEGFDVDVGYQKRLRNDAPVNAWLAGMTFHW